MSEWANKYVGIPFKAHGRTTKGADCWGLIRIAYLEQRAIWLPDFSEQYTCSFRAEDIEPLVVVEKLRMKEVLFGDEQPFDIVVLRVGGSEIHFGLVVCRGKMLHTHRGINSCIEEYRRPLWSKRLAGFFRYV